jgi:hypothetical protein
MAAAAATLAPDWTAGAAAAAAGFGWTAEPEVERKLVRDFMVQSSVDNNTKASNGRAEGGEDE